MSPRAALRRLLHLEPGELRRLWPFFLMYFVLFCLLSMADGLSLALFVKRVGAAELPRYYALTAILNLIVIGVYVTRAERFGSTKTFYLILAATLASFGGTWLAIVGFGGGRGTYGLLFAAREVAYTVLVMHFGTFLQDYFTRVELNRVLTIVYSGGRTGGIAGGFLLEVLSGVMGLTHVLLVCVGLSFAAMLVTFFIRRGQVEVRSAADEVGDQGLARPDGAGEELEREALTSLKAFLRFVVRSPLMRWTTIASVVYMGVRWILNYQYSTYFETHFETDVEMAAFMGRYTQVALSIALFMQLFVIGRMVTFLGLKASHLIYAAMVVVGMVSNAFTMSFGQAIFSRALETELRFGLRNPINQLLVNKYSKALRIRVRAWSLGFLIPASTLLVSGSLAILARGAGAGVAFFGAAVGLSYFGSCVGINRTFREKTAGAEEVKP